MKIEEQVLSIEQMNHLKELGLRVEDTALCWADLSEPGKFTVSPKYENAHEILREGCVITPTLTLQEIIILLPPSIKLEGQYRNIYLSDSIADGQIWYETINCIKIFESDGKTLLESAYQMLCWVIENGYLKL